jgi:hypothetical protein
MDVMKHQNPPQWSRWLGRAQKWNTSSKIGQQQGNGTSPIRCCYRLFLQKSLKWWFAISSLDFKGHPL